MTSAGANTGWDAEMELLHAYHDGELHGFRRWRFERRLQRDAALRTALAELSEIASFIREDDALRAAAGPSTPGTPGAPGIWQSIAGSLDAIDAQVEAEQAGRARAPAPAVDEPAAAWFPGWAAGWKVGAAVAAAAVIAVVLVTNTPPDEGAAGGAPVEQLAAGTVRYIDTSAGSIMVMDDKADAFTVLWMMDEV